MTATYSYPVPLGIAYILLAGCVIRALFVYMHLPASVGVMLSGFIFRHFFQSDLFFARDELQALAFFLVLLIAGLEIRFSHLKGHIFVMAVLPAACEILGIAAYAILVMHYTKVQGLVLGTVLVAMGDGLVIPKMQEFGQRFPKHELPRLVFTWAPLEASFALTTFGVLTGFASPAHTDPAPAGTILFANAFRLLATAGMGAVLGGVGAFCIKHRTKIGMFNGSTTEGLLMLLATALIGFALGKGDSGHELVPMGFASGSMFQPELLVIITGTVFASVCDTDSLHNLEHALGQVWVLGQIVLFSMLGSKTAPDFLPQLGRLLPVMVTGLVMRFIGVALGILMTLHSRKRPLWAALPDTIFCFLCTLPRATIQGALGGVPKKQHFFYTGYSNDGLVTDYIFTAAQLYVLCYSVIGMILLNTFGPRLLQYTESAERTEQTDKALPSEDLEVQNKLLEQRSSREILPAPGLYEVGLESPASDSWGGEGMHSFEASAHHAPRVEKLPGWTATPTADMSEQRPRPHEIGVLGLLPKRMEVTVPQNHDANEPLRITDGDIRLDLSPKKSRRPGDRETISFGPEADFLVRVPASPKERHYDFLLGGKHVSKIRIKVPANCSRLKLYPDALMVDISAAAPGKCVVFKHPVASHPAAPYWLRVIVPDKMPETRILPVRLPSVQYRSMPAHSLSCGPSELWDEVCMEFEEILESIWRLWRWLWGGC
ncbi:unnamed protein product [Effrenium voratum]|nr:unnamed protein product [Effrenium voratum]